MDNRWRSIGWAGTMLALGFLGCTFAMAFSMIADTDSWTHLSFGRWIWEHRAVPAGEPFIKTGAPFPYNNWLFGLAYYSVYLAGGIAGVITLKAVIVTCIFAVLLALALRPHHDVLIAVPVLLVVAMMLRFRFVERPDTVMMLCLALSVLCLEAYVADGRKWLWLLPVVHVVWANSHTSIVVMVVPFFAYLAGGWLQGYAGGIAAKRVPPRVLGFAPGLAPAQLRTIAIVFALSLLASLLSPYFVDQFTHSFRAVQSDWWRQEITELRRPTWEERKVFFILSALAAVSFVLSRRRLSLIDAAVALPLLVLSFVAVRFMWFAAISGVYLARNLSTAAAGWHGAEWRRSPGVLAGALLVTGALTTLHLRGVPPFDFYRYEMKAGLGVNYEFLPEGGLAYLDRVGASGRIFNLFEWGGYIVWRDFPRRQPFIDGRGFLSDELLELSGRAIAAHQVLDGLQRDFGFESVLYPVPRIQYAVMREAARKGLLLTQPHWALVYWDDRCMVLLRREGPYQQFVARDEYRYALPYADVDAARLADPAYREPLLAELRRNVRETASSRGRLLLGHALNGVGEHREAIAVLAGVRSTRNNDFEVDALIQTGYAHRMLGERAEAIRHYEKALAAWPSAEVLQNLGMLHAAQGQSREAVRYYERALELNSDLLSVYHALIEIHRSEGRTTAAKTLAARLKSAEQVSAGRIHFNAGLQAYFARDYRGAISEFEQSISANPANPAAYSNLGYVYYDIGNLDKAYELHRRALALDVNAAISYYGLAMIFRDRKEPTQAIRHWEQYLRIEPEGRFSRRAKEEIDALRR